jgi:hypothetical protein
VDIKLHRKSLGDEMLRGEAACQLDPILGRQRRIGWQRQHDLAGDLRVLAFLRRLRRIPQHRAVGEPGIGTFRQQHRVMLRRVAVPEVEHLAGALGGDPLARILGR